MDELQRFLADVEAHLVETGLTPTAFGTKAAGDPNFVFDLRAGREPRFSTIEKVRAFMGDGDRKSPVSRGTAAPDEAAA